MLAKSIFLCHNIGMAWNEYKDLIDFGKLKSLAFKRGLSMSALGRNSGISGPHCINIIAGRFIPGTETVARICGYLECSVDEIVDFKGFEVKEYYKGRDPFVPHEAEEDVLYRTSFEPLRQLLLDVYGEEQYPVKMRELMSKIEPVGGTEIQIERISVLHEKKIADDISRGKRGEGHGSYGRIPGTRQACFRRDRPINMRFVYNLCRVLGCTPAWVLTYK